MNMQMKSSKLSRRDDMLEGKLVFPEQIHRLVKAKKTTATVIETMFHSIWNSYLRGPNTTSLPYWADQVNEVNKFNQYLLHLTKSGWLVTKVIPTRNWAEVSINEEKLEEFLSHEELIEIRREYKNKKYSLKTANSEVGKNPLAGGCHAKLNSGIKRTGIVRFGFAKSGRAKFKYDLEMLEKNKEDILTYSKKAMIKLGIDDLEDDPTKYDRIIEDVIDGILKSQGEEYILGKCIADSRGRAIFDALKRIFNPISNKMARSLLITPAMSCSTEAKFTRALTNCYLFIAELLEGNNFDTFRKKREFGKKAFKNRTILELNHEKEDELDEMFHNIWLERMYNEVEAAISYGINYKWSVPVELDATASQLMIEGTLLNHKPFLQGTNAHVENNKVSDIWSVDGTKRKLVKRTVMPITYGSSKSPKTLLKKHKEKYTKDDLKVINDSLNKGIFRVAKNFTDSIVDNVLPSKEMKIVSRNEIFKVEANRFKMIGDKTKHYQLFDSEKGRPLLIKHTTTHQEADMNQFKRYFVTGLIHQLDSQIANSICLVLDWCLPIHDAFIVNPVEAERCRLEYASRIDDLFAERKEILFKYFKSVNLQKKGYAKIQELLDSTDRIVDFKCSKYALK